MDPRAFVHRRSAILTEAAGILKEREIKYRFRWDSTQSFSYPRDRFILMALGNPLTHQTFLSTLFHEIGHIVAFERGKYFTYHNCGRSTVRTKALSKNWIRTGLRAERYADRLGAELMLQYYPEIEYLAAYSHPQAVANWRTLFWNQWKKDL